MRRKRVARTRTEARSLLRQLQTETAAGVLGSGQATLATYLEDWLTHVLPARDVSPATVENYDWAVHKHIVPELGDDASRPLRADDVDRLLRSMADDGKARSRSGSCAPCSSSRSLTLSGETSSHETPPRLSILPQAPVRVSRAMTVDQGRSLLAARARGDRLEGAWVTMLLTGIRPGEVLGLPWEDVDLDAASSASSQALKRQTGSRFAIGDPKTPKSRRTLDLPELVVEVLRAHRARQAAERLAAASLWEDSGLVFSTMIGTPIDPRNFRRAFAKLTEAAGLGPWHRTSCGTRPSPCCRLLGSGSRMSRTSLGTLRRASRGTSTATPSHRRSRLVRRRWTGSSALTRPLPLSSRDPVAPWLRDGRLLEG